MTIVWIRGVENSKMVPENLRIKMESFGEPLDLATPGTPGFEYYKLKPEQGDPEFVKKHYNAFTVPELKEYLHANEIENIVFTGVFTGRCVFFSVVGASSTESTRPNKNYNCIVAQDLVSSATQQAEESAKALGVMNSLTAFVVPSTKIVDVWKSMEKVKVAR